MAGPFFNSAPLADAGSDQTVECVGPAGTAVTLNGLLSSDPDLDTLQVTWTDAGGAILAQGDASAAGMPTVNLAMGTHTITLTVMDAGGLTSSDTVQVTVEDSTAPAIDSAAPNPTSLWPPNHKMVPVTVSVDVSDASGSASCQIVSVSSNEPVNGNGDGNTAPDWEITGDLTVDLRAERSGNGNGRIYTISLECEDDAGNLSNTAVQVTVPKSKKK